MKSVFTAALLLTSMSAYALPDHQSEKHGKHAHSEKCGHKAETHTLSDGTSHVDYEHDGHHHFAHGNHYDECKGREAETQASR